MAGRDGFGPMGQGPMSGWGMGPCSGRGRGYGRRGYRGFGAGFRGFPMTPEDQNSLLDRRQEFLEAELERIRELRGKMEAEA